MGGEGVWLMKKIILVIVLMPLFTLLAFADNHDDIARFVANTDKMGDLTATLRACGYNEKARVYHDSAMELIMSLSSSRPVDVPRAIENYKRGIADFETLSAGRKPTSLVCQDLLNFMAERGM